MGYRIKLSENMARQVEGVKKTFDTWKQAHNFATTKYGSGSEDTKHGWSIEEVKIPDFINPTVKKSIRTAAGTAHYLKTEIEDDLGRWNDNYYTRDGYWVIHKGRQHHVYKIPPKSKISAGVRSPHIAGGKYQLAHSKGWHEDADLRTGKAPIHKAVAERAQAKHAQNTLMKKQGYFIMMEDGMGNITLSHSGSKRVAFFQAESDKEFISDLLKKDEKEDMENGYDVKINDSEPRASALSELWEASGGG